MKAAFAMLAAVAVLQAQQPQVENGRLDSRLFSGSIAGELKTLGSGTYWAAWSQPVTPLRKGDMCGPARGIVRLEGESTLVVLVRMENGRIDQLRATSPDCRIDAGELPFHWIEGVPASEHAAWLKAQLSTDNSDRIGEQVLFLLSESVEPGAMAMLFDSAKNGRSVRLRNQALFWIAQRAAEKQALDVIGHSINDDPETAVKEQAVFALTQLPHDQGTPLLIEVAKNNANPAVRKKAVFWLGQSKDPRAIDFFAQVLRP